jgi:hypothetical protein
MLLPVGQFRGCVPQASCLLWGSRVPHRFRGGGAMSAGFMPPPTLHLARIIWRSYMVCCLTLLSSITRASASSPAASDKAAATAADFYVAPDGKDTNPGTATAPFATVARARDAVRPKVAVGLDRNVLVQIRGGVYPQTETLLFGPQDSGTQTHSVTYAAAPGEKVTLSGGRAITGWKRGTGQIWTAELPDVTSGKWYFRQVFVGDRRAIRARTPNAGEPWWQLQPRADNSQANDVVVTLGVNHPIRAWRHVADVEVTWLVNNDGTRKRLASVRESDNTFTLPPPHAWPHGMTNEYNISFPRGEFPCYFENALEMLDQPGEWYLDRQTGVLSYWPRSGEDLTRAEVIAPAVQNTLLALRGTPEHPVRNLHFQGIRVAHVDWRLPPFGFTGLFGCLQIQEEKDPKGPKKFYWIDAAVSFRHARGCRFIDGAIEHSGAIGLAILTGCTENTVEGNDIGDLGGGGIVAGGIRNRDTWQWADPIQNDDHKGYRIANNHVHDCGIDYFGSIGIFTGLMRESVIAHNLIHDTAYTGIVVSGNESPKPPFAGNNTVEYNHIHHVMKVAQDGAAIYVSFPQADRGAVIRGNLIHDTGHRGQHNGQYCGGLYTDAIGDHCLGYQFVNNVVYHSDAPLMVPAREFETLLWVDNLTYRGTAGRFSADAVAPPAELLEVLENRAGLEPNYRRSLLGTDEPPCELHSLTDETREQNVWSAQQYHWPKKDAGVVLAFRRVKSDEAARTIRLRGLDPNASYEITGLGGGPGQTATGKVLMEQGVTLEIARKPEHASCPGHAAIRYRKL